MRRQEETIDQLRQQQAAVAALLDAKGSGPVRTKALPRPNAYIPEELGIPKPYGGFSPFKPTEPGTTMRHIKKPVPQEVVI